MNQIKGILKASLAKDPLDIIFWAEPSSQTFQEALAVYKSSSMQVKSQIQQRAFKKLQKQKQPKIGLAILCLLDYITSQGYQMNLNHIKSNISIQKCQTQKQKTLELSFFNLYNTLINIQTKKPCKSNQIDNQDFESVIKYCQAAIQYIFKVIMFDFLIEHCLSQAEHKQITNIIVNRILKTVQTDLKILCKFLDDNLQKIITGHDKCFNINQIYEKTLFFGKQRNKLQILKRKAGSNANLQFYKLNSELNRKIEKYILSRDSQRKQFASEKNIGSFKKCDDDIHNFGTCPDIIFEDSILLENDQFIC